MTIVLLNRNISLNLHNILSYKLNSSRSCKNMFNAHTAALKSSAVNIILIRPFNLVFCAFLCINVQLHLRPMPK